MEASPNGIYKYKPNQPICIVAACLFGTSAAYHTYKMIRTRTWYHISLVIGSWMMTFGYIVRFISTKDTLALLPYIMQCLLIILPPSLYAATLYMIYKRLCLSLLSPQTTPSLFSLPTPPLSTTNLLTTTPFTSQPFTTYFHTPSSTNLLSPSTPTYSTALLINPHLTTTIFVTGDIFAFTLQALAGGLLSSPPTSLLGEKIMLVGLTIQLLFFLLFLCVASVFYRSLPTFPNKTTSNRTTGGNGKRNCSFNGWSKKVLFWWLITAAIVIVLRCVFRIVEFGQGSQGWLFGREVFLYMCDALPMVVVQGGFGFFWAGDAIAPRVEHEVDGLGEAGLEKGVESGSESEGNLSIVVVECV